MTEPTSVSSYCTIILLLVVICTGHPHPCHQISPHSHGTFCYFFFACCTKPSVTRRPLQFRNVGQTRRDFVLGMLFFIVGPRADGFPYSCLCRINSLGRSVVLRRWCRRENFLAAASCPEQHRPSVLMLLNGAPRAMA